MDFTKLKDFYRGKRVFVTGHTGFKGSWLTLMLKMLGADVYGYALEPPTDPDLFTILGLKDEIHHEIGDIRDFPHLQSAFMAAAPDVVFHLAAQPIVRDSYKYPRETYETNVMGTVNLLECVRRSCASGDFMVESVVNVTTDKVYENNDAPEHAFREEEKLDGYDPYSNSKSCSELVTHAYAKSFFTDASGTGRDRMHLPEISTARAGNVIGGGDFANDRIIPDCVRDTMAGKPIHVRNPYSTRPYQHVLEPLTVYLMIAMEQIKAKKLSGAYNVGPDTCDAITTGELAELFVKYWGEEASWQSAEEANAPHEANFLRLDCGKLKQTFHWQPVWHVEEAVRETVRWYRAWQEGSDMRAYTEAQIRDFLG